MKITLVLPYFGQWPFWFDFFLLSCRRNPSVQWLLTSNASKLREAFARVENWRDLIYADTNQRFDEKAFSKLFIRYKSSLIRSENISRAIELKLLLLNAALLLIAELTGKTVQEISPQNGT